MKCRLSEFLIFLPPSLRTGITGVCHGAWLRLGNLEQLQVYLAHDPDNGLVL